MKKKFAGIFLLVFCNLQGVVYGQKIPEQYISEALTNNLVLKEKKISLDKSLLALREAKSYFLPTTWFEGQYILSKGGRTIDIPVGDLLNPVYNTLNQLTGTHDFAPVANASEQLNPNNFYDVRIRTTVPIINPAIGLNRNISQQKVYLQQNETDIYRRELIKDVKTAYFNYLMLENAEKIYGNALEVVQENLRVNQSLLTNGKGLPAYVSRAESEVQLVQSQLLNAGNEKENARAYFNFLLNRPLTDSIIATPVLETDHLPVFLAESNVLTESREELKSLKLARNINENILKINRSYKVPRLNAFLDLASQGFDFKVNNKSLFYLGGIQLTIPIFTGKRNLYKIGQAELDMRDIEFQKDHIKQQLELAVFTSRNNVVNAYRNYHAVQKQEEAAIQYFKLIDKGYREGVNSFIELLDARNELTNVRLQVNINRYGILIALADYERQTASYSLQ